MTPLKEKDCVKGDAAFRPRSLCGSWAAAGAGHGSSMAACAHDMAMGFKGSSCGPAS